MAFYEGKTLKTGLRARAPASTKPSTSRSRSPAASAAPTSRVSFIATSNPPTSWSRSRRLKILDFGLAKLAGQTRSPGRNDTGHRGVHVPRTGTGEDVDHRTDIWSLGVVVYEMLSGKVAFQRRFRAGDHLLGHERRARTAGRCSARHTGRTHRHRHQGAAKKRTHRYQQAKELLDDLVHLKRRLEPDEVGIRGRWYFLLRLRPYMVAAAVAVLAALLVVVVILLRPPAPTGAAEFGQPGQVTSGDVWLDEPALSPDGGRIAYPRRLRQPGPPRLDVRGGNPYQLMQDPAADCYPAWFPDGTELALVSDRPPARESGVSGSSAAGPRSWWRTPSTPRSPPTVRGSPSRRRGRAESPHRCCTAREPERGHHTHWRPRRTVGSPHPRLVAGQPDDLLRHST